MTPAQHDRAQAQYMRWLRLTRLFRGVAPALIIWDGIIPRVQWERARLETICLN